MTDLTKALFEIPPTPWYQLLAAQLFGTPFLSIDGLVGIAGYRWRGCIYVTSHVDLTH